MRLPSLRFFAVMLTACACAGVASTQARADWVTGFTGYTYMDINAGIFGKSPDYAVVSYSVFKNDGTGSLGLSSPTTSSGSPAAVNLSAPYVYLYQMVNVNTKLSNAGTALELLQIPEGNLFTSAGFFSGKVYNDGQSTPTSTANNPGDVGVYNHSTADSSRTVVNWGLGTDPAGYDPLHLGGSGLPTLDGSWSSTYNSDTVNTENPIQYLLNSGYAEFQWPSSGPLPGLWPADNTSATTSTSPILVLTSNFAPMWDTGHAHDGFPPASGLLPTPVPEPGSLILAGMGLVGVFGYYGRRKLTAKQA